MQTLSLMTFLKFNCGIIQKNVFHSHIIHTVNSTRVCNMCVCTCVCVWCVYVPGTGVLGCVSAGVPVEGVFGSSPAAKAAARLFSSSSAIQGIDH